MASAVPTLVAQLHLARRRGEMLVRSSPFWRRQMFYAALLLDMRAAKEIRLFGLAAVPARPDARRDALGPGRGTTRRTGAS